MGLPSSEILPSAWGSICLRANTKWAPCLLEGAEEDIKVINKVRLQAALQQFFFSSIKDSQKFIHELKVHPCSQHLEKPTIKCIFLGMLLAGISPLLQHMAVGHGITASDHQGHFVMLHLCPWLHLGSSTVLSLGRWSALAFHSAGSRLMWWQCWEIVVPTLVLWTNIVLWLCQ